MEPCVSCGSKEGAAVPIPSPKSAIDCIALSFCGETFCNFLNYREIISISYNTDTGVMPDLYAQCSKACIALGYFAYMYIRHTFSTLKLFPSLKWSAQLAYIVTGAGSDCGRYF